MKRWLVILGIIVAVIVAALVVVSFLIDAETFRGPIERGLADATGWDAELEALDFSLLRGMVLTAGPVRLAAPGDTSFARLDRLEVRAKLFPLLRGEIHVEGITLVSPEVRIVRPDLETGWVLPLPPAGPAAPGSGDSAPGRAPALTLDRIRLTGGKFSIEDRAVDPPLMLGLSEVDLTLAPATSEVDGSAQLDPGGGDLRFQGTSDGGFGLTLEGVPTEFLHTWASPELIHGGGTVTGDIRLEFPAEVTGDLEGKNVVLLAGTRPFEELRMQFAIASSGGSVVLDRLAIDAGGLAISGAGTLAPAIALELEIPDGPLEAALVASESAMPIPIDVEPPGRVKASLRVDKAAGEAPLTYEADGELSAALLRFGKPLPDAEAVRAAFVLNPEGELTIRVLDGKVGGGPVTGTAFLDSIDPPGKLTIKGGLADASLGGLLTGFVASAERLKGPTRIDSDLALDLSHPVGDMRALSGRVELGSSPVTVPGWDIESAITQSLSRQLGANIDLASALGRDPATAAAADAIERVFENVDAAIDFDSWPWSLEHFRMGVGEFASSGLGTFNPETGEVDLRLDASLSASASSELVARTPEVRYLLDDRGRLVMPMTIKGPLMQPTIDVDLDSLVDAALEREKDDLERKAKDKLGGLLNRLLKKDDD